MSMVPIVASVADLDKALKYAQLHPSSRWYVASRAVSLGAGDQVPDDWGVPIVATSFTDEQRAKLAESGDAMPDGSFPIRNGTDLEHAISLCGNASDPAAAKRHIRKRAEDLGLTDKLPESWGPVTASADEPVAIVAGLGHELHKAFDTALHPRGHDGKFINVGGHVQVLDATGKPVAEGTVMKVVKDAAGGTDIHVHAANGDDYNVHPALIQNAPTAKAHIGVGDTVTSRITGHTGKVTKVSGDTAHVDYGGHPAGYSTSSVHELHNSGGERQVDLPSRNTKTLEPKTFKVASDKPFDGTHPKVTDEEASRRTAQAYTFSGAAGSASEHVTASRAHMHAAQAHKELGHGDQAQTHYDAAAAHGRVAEGRAPGLQEAHAQVKDERAKTDFGGKENYWKGFTSPGGPYELASPRQKVEARKAYDAGWEAQGPNKALEDAHAALKVYYDRRGGEATPAERKTAHDELARRAADTRSVEDRMKAIQENVRKTHEQIGGAKFVGGAHLEMHGREELANGKTSVHHKFYESSVVAHPDGTASHVVRFGPDDMRNPKNIVRDHPDVESARAAHDKVIGEKTKKGYVNTRGIGAVDEIEHARLANARANPQPPLTAPASLDAKRAEHASRTPREIGDALAEDPKSVSMDELQRVSKLGNKDSAAANAEIGRRDGPARDSSTDMVKSDLRAQPATGPGSRSTEDIRKDLGGEFAKTGPGSKSDEAARAAEPQMKTDARQRYEKAAQKHINETTAEVDGFIEETRKHEDNGGVADRELTEMKSHLEEAKRSGDLKQELEASKRVRQRLIDEGYNDYEDFKTRVPRGESPVAAPVETPGSKELAHLDSLKTASDVELQKIVDRKGATPEAVRAEQYLRERQATGHRSVAEIEKGGYHPDAGPHPVNSMGKYSDAELEKMRAQHESILRHEILSPENEKKYINSHGNITDEQKRRVVERSLPDALKDAPTHSGYVTPQLKPGTPISLESTTSGHVFSHNGHRFEVTSSSGGSPPAGGHYKEIRDESGKIHKVLSQKRTVTYEGEAIGNSDHVVGHVGLHEPMDNRFEHQKVSDAAMGAPIPKSQQGGALHQSLSALGPQPKADDVQKLLPGKFAGTGEASSDLQDTRKAMLDYIKDPGPATYAVMMGNTRGHEDRQARYKALDEGAKPRVPGVHPELAATTADHPLHGIAKSLGNKGGSESVGRDRVTSILHEQDHAKAHKDLAALMSEAKLGGKQRARYREMLNEHHGNPGGGRPAASLSSDNPLRDRLQAAQLNRAPSASEQHAAGQTEVEKAHDFLHGPTVGTPPDSMRHMAEAYTPAELAAAIRRYPAGTPAGDIARAEQARRGAIPTTSNVHAHAAATAKLPTVQGQPGSGVPKRADATTRASEALHAGKVRDVRQGGQYVSPHVTVQDLHDPTTTHMWDKGKDGQWRHGISSTYGNQSFVRQAEGRKVDASGAHATSAEAALLDSHVKAGAAHDRQRAIDDLARYKAGIPKRTDSELRQLAHPGGGKDRVQYQLAAEQELERRGYKLTNGRWVKQGKA